uniref:Ribonuclease P and MRP subunit p25, b n=1 Tax=Oryzias latipes TaxID=8090 RepID=A0A3P9IFD5_ORYLA
MKVCRTEEDSPSPFPGLPPGVLEMRVKEGSKIRNLMGFAMARIAGLRQVVFTGSGRAVTKTITCAEIMKRKVGRLHQLTKLRYKVIKEVWESAERGTSEMTLHRTVPSISILLSKDPLDPQEPGYQPPEAVSALWEGTGPSVKCRGVIRDNGRRTRMREQIKHTDKIINLELNPMRLP